MLPPSDYNFFLWLLKHSSTLLPYFSFSFCLLVCLMNLSIHSLFYKTFKKRHATSIKKQGRKKITPIILFLISPTWQGSETVRWHVSYGLSLGFFRQESCQTLSFHRQSFVGGDLIGIRKQRLKKKKAIIIANKP